MKKNYSKPEIVFESFKLSTSIAGTCTQQANSGDENSCEFTTPMGFTIFVSACTDESEFSVQDGEYGFCYDVPNDDKRVFAS